MSRNHSLLYSTPMLSLTSQNTLTKTSVWHFLITNEAVTDAFMFRTTHRNLPPLFSSPHTSINSRYTNIWLFRDGVKNRVIYKNVVYWMCLKIVLQYVSTSFVYATSCANYFFTYKKLRKQSYSDNCMYILKPLTCQSQ